MFFKKFYLVFFVCCWFFCVLFVESVCVCCLFVVGFLFCFLCFLFLINAFRGFGQYESVT